MAPENLIGIVSLAFALGLMHALDTDHVIAVSTLACGRQRNTRNPRWYGLRWALGHGGILLLFGVLVLGAGITIADTFSNVAETLVGLLMILMGVVLIHRMRNQQQADLRKLRQQPQAPAAIGHQHGATAIGALHGMAGSATLFALVPAISSGSAWLSMLYLTTFSLGVLCSMLLCATALGALFERLNRIGKRALSTLRYIIAGGSIMAGAYLLKSIF